jgi:hypothetical protein
MKRLTTLLLLVTTIANIFFMIWMYGQMKAHEEVINRHGTILSLMLVTPEIKAALERQLDTQEKQ